MVFLLFLFGFGSSSHSSFVNNVVQEGAYTHLCKHNGGNHKNCKEHANGINVPLPYLIETRRHFVEHVGFTVEMECPLQKLFLRARVGVVAYG
jgi:hypothetical protein